MSVCLSVFLFLSFSLSISLFHLSLYLLFLLLYLFRMPTIYYPPPPCLSLYIFFSLLSLFRSLSTCFHLSILLFPFSISFSSLLLYLLSLSLLSLSHCLHLFPTLSLFLYISYLSPSLYLSFAL